MAPGSDRIEGQATGSAALESIRRTAGKAAAAALMTSGQEDAAVDSLGMARIAAVLASASEGETFEKLASAASIKDKRADRVYKAHEALARRSAAWPGLASAQGIWMIWPIAVTPEFQQKAASSLGFTIKRLGSAGVGSRAALDEWLRVQTGSQASFDYPLDKTHPLLGLSALAIRPLEGFAFAPGPSRTFHGPKGAEEAPFLEGRAYAAKARLSQGALACVTQPKNPLALCLYLPDPGRGMEEAARLVASGGLPEALAKAGKQQTAIALPRGGIHRIADMKESWEKAGLGLLAQPGLDLRYMALELTSADAPRWLQAVEASWEPSAAPSSPSSKASSPDLVFDRPFAWILWDSGLNLAIAAGVVRQPGPPSPDAGR